MILFVEADRLKGFQSNYGDGAFNHRPALWAAPKFFGSPNSVHCHRNPNIEIRDGEQPFTGNEIDLQADFKVPV